MLENRFKYLLSHLPLSTRYGEVTPYLRYSGEWLKKRFDARLILLVRDGRDYVVSAGQRGIFEADHPQLPIVPRDDDPYAHRWNNMCYFEKVCWYWMHTHNSVKDQVDDFVQFEQILADYGYFKNKILDALELSVSEEDWQRAVTQPVNQSRRSLKETAKKWVKQKHTQPAVFETGYIHSKDKWSSEEYRQFEEICGPIMMDLGYSLDNHE